MDRDVLNPLLMKLRHAVHLTDEDAGRLDALVRGTRTIPARTDIIGEGERPSDVHLVMSGFACRYKTLRDGKRQIMALLVPGDFCDLHVAILGAMDHSLGTISECTLVEIPADTVLDLVGRFDRITRALWWATLVEEAILREWLVNMGQRPAARQLAHLLCELRRRLQAVGLVRDDVFNLPLTQTELADTLGLTPVHVNRMLQQLRADGLIAMQASRVLIPNPARLEAFCGFDPLYLHLNGRGPSRRGGAD